MVYVTYLLFGIYVVSSFSLLEMGFTVVNMKGDMTVPLFLRNVLGLASQK